MDAAERASEHHQQLFDVETANTTDNKEHLRQLGLSKLDAVLSKAQAGQDPWEYQQQPGRSDDTAADGAADVHDADVAAMGAWLEKYKPLLLAGGYIIAQGSSWVLMKVCILSRSDCLALMQPGLCNWPVRLACRVAASPVQLEDCPAQANWCLRRFMSHKS
jgi:hypothetical protein